MASGPFRRGGNIFVIFTLTRNECFCAIAHLLTRDSLMKKASEKLLLQLQRKVALDQETSSGKTPKGFEACRLQTNLGSTAMPW